MGAVVFLSIIGELSLLGYILFFLGIILTLAIGLLIGMGLKARRLAKELRKQKEMEKEGQGRMQAAEVKPDSTAGIQGVEGTATAPPDDNLAASSRIGQPDSASSLDTAGTTGQTSEGSLSGEASSYSASSSDITGTSASSGVMEGTSGDYTYSPSSSFADALRVTMNENTSVSSDTSLQGVSTSEYPASTPEGDSSTSPADSGATSVASPDTGSSVDSSSVGSVGQTGPSEITSITSDSSSVMPDTNQVSIEPVPAPEPDLPICPDCKNRLEPGWSECFRCKLVESTNEMKKKLTAVKEARIKSKSLDEQLAELENMKNQREDQQYEKVLSIVAYADELLEINRTLMSQIESAKSTIAAVEKEGKDVTSSKNTLYLATSFKEQGNIEKAMRYAVKAERLAKDIGGITQIKTPEPPPSESAVSESTLEIHHRALICIACKGVIKPGLPVTKCACGKNYHENCAQRIIDCPACGKKL
ncbi:MAG: hypothetical protein QW728_00635 [Thermoplasmata archaeon]